MSCTSSTNASRWRRTAAGSSRRAALQSASPNMRSRCSLTAEQFSQVIDAAAGRVLRLLRASSTDKAKILKTLFDCELWDALPAGSSCGWIRFTGRGRPARRGCGRCSRSTAPKARTRFPCSLRRLRRRKRRSPKHSKQRRRRAEGAGRARPRERIARLQAELQAAEKERAAAGAALQKPGRTPPRPSPRARDRSAAKTRGALERQFEALRQEQSRAGKNSGFKRKCARRKPACAGSTATRRPPRKQRETRARIEKGEEYLAGMRGAPPKALPGVLEKKRAGKTRDSLRDLHEAQKTHDIRLKALEEKDARALEKPARADRAGSRPSPPRECAEPRRRRAAPPPACSTAPCPLCGAVHHPQPAVPAEAVPSEAEFEALRAQLERCARNTRGRKAKPPPQRPPQSSPGNARRRSRPMPSPPRPTPRKSSGGSPPAPRGSPTCKKRPARRRKTAGCAAKKRPTHSSGTRRRPGEAVRHRPSGSNSSAGRPRNSATCATSRRSKPRPHARNGAAGARRTSRRAFESGRRSAAEALRRSKRRAGERRKSVSAPLRWRSRASERPLPAPAADCAEAAEKGPQADRRAARRARPHGRGARIGAADPPRPFRALPRRPKRSTAITADMRAFMACFRAKTRCACRFCSMS